MAKVKQYIIIELSLIDLVTVLDAILTSMQTFFLEFKLSNASPQEKISSFSKLNFQDLCRIDVSAFRIFVAE